MTTEAEQMVEALENDGVDCTCAAYSASECCCDANWAEYHAKDAAALIRQQAAEIERLKSMRFSVSDVERSVSSRLDKADALLRQALEALESCYEGDYSTGHVIDPSFDSVAVDNSISAIKQHLGEV